jgi:putative peptidoglycan lipid II flippase
VGLSLSVGVLLAGFAQVALVAWAAREAGMRLVLRRPALTPELRRLVQIGIPAAVAGGVLQINTLIGTVIASFFAGAVSWLSYADRLYQLPLGLVGVAIGVVLLPELSRRVRAGDRTGAREAMNRAAEFALMLTLPASVALMVMPAPIVHTLFERGAFGPADTAAVAAALGLFAAGLPAFVLQKVIQPAYFAREDTVGPLRFAAISVAVNVAVSVLGAPLFGFLSIPLGTTVGGWLNLWLLWRGAAAFGPDAAIDPRLRERAPRILKAALVMGAVLWLLTGWAMREMMTSDDGRWTALFLVIVVAMAAYFWAARAFGAFEMRDLRAALRRGA